MATLTITMMIDGTAHDVEFDIEIDDDWTNDEYHVKDLYEEFRSLPIDVVGIACSECGDEIDDMARADSCSCNDNDDNEEEE